MSIVQGHSISAPTSLILRSIGMSLSTHNLSCCLCNTCWCDSAIKWHTHKEQECIMQFLIGLKSSYSQVRSTILSMGPLPPLSKVFSLVFQEERQRTIDGNLASPIHLLQASNLILWQPLQILAEENCCALTVVEPITLLIVSLMSFLKVLERSRVSHVIRIFLKNLLKLLTMLMILYMKVMTKWLLIHCLRLSVMLTVNFPHAITAFCHISFIIISISISYSITYHKNNIFITNYQVYFLLYEKSAKVIELAMIYKFWTLEGC